FRFSRTCLEPIFTKMRLKSENRRNARDRPIFAFRTQDYFCACVKIQVSRHFQIFTIFTPTGDRPSLQAAAGPIGAGRHTAHANALGRVKWSRVRSHAVTNPPAAAWLTATGRARRSVDRA